MYTEGLGLYVEESFQNDLLCMEWSGMEWSEVE